MSRRFLFLLVAAGIGTGWAAAGDPAPSKRVSPEKAVAEQAARLVGELGSDDFDARERAAQQLEALGPAAGPALRQAMTNSDPEVRRLALRVAEKLARRMEAAEVLEPKRLRLVYRDVPLNVAAADFTRATGAPLQLDGVKGDRKITLDTGYTTFWDAYDKFCAAAGLSEKVFETPADSGTVNEMYGGPWGRRRMIMWNGRMPQQQEDIIPALSNGQFVLTEAKQPPRSHYQAGALRFRTLPGGMAMGRYSSVKGDKELIFGVEILPEPSLAWERVQTIRVTRAVDDQGQLLDVGHVTNGAEPPPSDFDDMVFYSGDYPGRTTHNGGQRVPLRLTLGRKSSKALKELSGVATIKMQTTTQAIATIDRVMEANGKSVKGSDGSFLKVVEVKAEEGGKVRIHVKIDQAQDENPNPWGGWGWRGMMWPGMGGGGENADSAVSTGNLVLFDARGNLVRLLSKEQIPDETGNGNEEYYFVYQVPRGAPEPAKLVLQGRRPVTIDVPFTLKDVPLVAAPGAPKPAAPPTPRPGAVEEAIGVDW
jgi:hypothetical protein